MAIQIETERLLLRQFAADNAEKLIEIAKQKHICNWRPGLSD